MICCRETLAVSLRFYSQFLLLFASLSGKPAEAASWVLLSERFLLEQWCRSKGMAWKKADLHHSMVGLSKIESLFHDRCMPCQLKGLGSLHEQMGCQEQGRMIHWLLIAPVSGCWKQPLGQDSPHPSEAVYTVEELHLSWSEEKWRLSAKTEASRGNQDAQGQPPWPLAAGQRLQVSCRPCVTSTSLIWKSWIPLGT